MAFSTSITNANVSLANLLTVIETITFSDLPGTPTIKQNWGDTLSTELINLDFKTAATTPSATNPVEVAITKQWADTITGTAGAHTIDLSALPRSTELGDLDLTGLKPQVLAFTCPFSNTHDVVIVPGATNGHNLLDDASSRVVVAPGGSWIHIHPENTTASTGMPDVGVADAEWDLSSTMTAFVINALILAG